MVCFRRNFRAHFREPPWRSGRGHMYGSTMLVILSASSGHVIVWFCSNFRIITAIFRMSKIFRFLWCHMNAFSNVAGHRLEPAAMRVQMIWAMSWENLFMPYVNNKGTGQPAHLCSLISTFVVRCLDSIIPLLQDPSQSHQLSRLVWVLTGHKPQRQVFSWHGSFDASSFNPFT